MTFNSIRLLLFFSCLIWQTFAKEIDKISYSNLKLTPLTSLRYPHQGWSASFDFNINNESSVLKGDYFSLNFPNVYRIKFDDEKMTTNVTLQDSSKAFECFAAQQAAYKNKDSIFECVAIKDLSPYSSLSGSLSFGLSFSSGGSAYQYELENANKFHSGTMQVSLTDQLSASVDFDSTNSTKDIYTIGRSTTFNSLESYYLAMSCPNGYLLGGTQTINYDKQGKGYPLDCSSVQVHLSDQFNDWYLPLKSDHANARVDCSGNTLKVNMNQTKANQKLWINALQDVSDGINTIQHEVSLQYSCSNTGKKTTYKTQFSTVVDYTIYQARDSGTLSGLTAPSTSVSSSNSTALPIASTITTGWTGTYNTTYSTGTTNFSVNTGSPSKEIIYYAETPSRTQVPKTTSTMTTGWTGTYDSTYSTASAVLTGSTGTPLGEIIYYLETPKTHSYNASLKSIRSLPGTTEINTIISTSATGWTGIYNSTYSTNSIGYGGNSGLSTEEIVYYVETPKPTTLPSSTFVKPQINKTSLTSQVISTPQGSFNFTSTTWSPHAITSSTTDLSSALITTCNCSVSVPVTKWSNSGAHNTIGSVPSEKTNYSTTVIMNNTQNFTKSSANSSGHVPLTSSVSSSKTQSIINSTKVMKLTLSAKTVSNGTSNFITSSPIGSTPSTEAGNITSSSPIATSSSIVSTTNISAAPITNTPIATTSSVIVSSTSVSSFLQVSSTPNASTASSSSQTINSGTGPPVTSSAVNSATPQQLSSRASSTTPISLWSNKDSHTWSSSPTTSAVSSSTGISPETPSQTSTTTSSPSSAPAISSAAAISTTPTISSKSSISNLSSSLSDHFSLGLSLDQGSIAQTPTVQTSVPCSVSISTVTITANATVTKHVRASVTHTVTKNASDCLNSAELHQSSLKPYSKSASLGPNSSLELYSAHGLVLEKGNSIAAFLGVLLFVV